MAHAHSETTPKNIVTAAWFAFDLDDTLHEFRKASQTAVNATLVLLASEHDHQLRERGISFDDLKSEYRKILTSSTSSAFVDGKTSHEYRSQRFQTLMNSFDLHSDDSKMKDLLDCYETIMMENLQLIPGALNVLKTLKAQGKKIAVITEGPQDAQERTIGALGLVSFVDNLVTTNALRKSKVDGLFPCVLQNLGLRPEDMIMVGDNWKRDIMPAREAGMSCVWFSDSVEEVMSDPEVMKISSLSELENIVKS